jgi:hypothetical protein
VPQRRRETRTHGIHRDMAGAQGMLGLDASVPFVSVESLIDAGVVNALVWVTNGWVQSLRSTSICSSARGSALQVMLADECYFTTLEIVRRFIWEVPVRALHGYHYPPYCMALPPCRDKGEGDRVGLAKHMTTAHIGIHTHRTQRQIGWDLCIRATVAASAAPAAARMLFNEAALLKRA